MAHCEQRRRDAGRAEDTDFAGRRCLAAFLVLLVLSSVAFAVEPGSVGVVADAAGGLFAEGGDLAPLARDGVLAAAGLAAVAFAFRESLRLAGRARCTLGEKAEASRGRPDCRMLAVLAVLAVLGALVGWLTMAFEGDLLLDGAGPRLCWGQGGATAAGVATLLLLCLFTGVYEEALFRPLLMGAIVRRGLRAPRDRWLAVAVSAGLFGIMHVGGTLTTAGFSSPAEALMPFARFVQTAAFGFLMAELFAATGSFWLVALVHAAFDLLLFAPTYLTAGTLPAYAASPQMLAIVLGSALVLAMLCAAVVPLLRLRNRT